MSCCCLPSIGQIIKSIRHYRIHPKALHRSAKATKLGNDRKIDSLTHQDQKKLLALARSTVKYCLKHNTRPSLSQLNIEVTKGMKESMGVFVTLKKEGLLRGCIGKTDPKRPLYEAVMDLAVSAAFFDDRFDEVTLEELPALEFGISVLGPLRPIESYEDIILGQHGIRLQKGNRHAIYLPHVASEQGWNVFETLRHLEKKAGLDENGPKSEIKLFVFEAVAFQEAKKSLLVGI